MAYRGRGRGKASMSISNEQLGFGKGEALPPPVLQPPPKYPPLEFKAPAPQMNAELSYLTELKRDYAETVHESLSNIQSVVVKRDIERYSDRYEKIMSDICKHDDYCDWSLMPRELKTTVAKRKAKEAKEARENVKRVKEIDIEKKLQELEKKENTNDNEVEEDNENDDDSEKDPDENVEDEEAEVDEEMDDGTDYVNNYFDNGEGYDDEEDNLDDGPIY